MISIIRALLFEGAALLVDERGEVWSFQGGSLPDGPPTVQRILTLGASSLGHELNSEATTRKIVAAWDHANGR